MAIKHILFPIDFSDRSCAAVPFVEAMARGYQAKITMLSVVPPIYYAGMGDPGGPIVTNPETMISDLRERSSGVNRPDRCFPVGPAISRLLFGHKRP
jgi:hypothetical protein